MAVRKPSRIVQIGCGVVGHAYAEAFANAGQTVFGIEASRRRMSEISSYPMYHISDDLSSLVDIDFILLSINTPLDPSTGALSMNYLWSALPNVVTLMTASPNALVVVRSTVTIGFSASFCDALSAALATALGKEKPAAVRLCFQPEFLRAKSALADATRPWQVVLGCANEAEVEDYAAFQTLFISADKITYCTIDEAEIMKIFHNSFNAMKISYFNQAALLVDKVRKRDGKDIDAARTFSIIAKTCEGLMNPLYGLTPGHAYYGSCLPKDSAELAHMETEYGLHCGLFQAVVDVNEVVKKSDKEEVIHGDNHADNALFHRTAPFLLRGTKECDEKADSLVSLTGVESLTDSSVDSS